MAQIDPLRGAQHATLFPPNGSVANPIGLVAPAILQSNHPEGTKRKMAKVAADLLRDPLAMEQFRDRIYQLLQEDIQAQKTRSYSYGRRH